MTAWQTAGFLLCVAVATCAQRLTGFALALILLGLTGLFDIAPLPDVANVATVLALANAAIVLRGAHKSLDWPILRATALGSVVGVAGGVALLVWLNANVVMVLRLLLGLVVIACALIVLLRAKPLPQRSSAGSFRAYGMLSGLLGGLFSASGPPLVYQFYRQPIDLDTLRDTLIAALATSSLLRLLMVLPTGQFSFSSLKLSLVALPLTMAITWWFQRHPPGWSRAAVLKLVCGLLLVTGAGLVGPALRSIAAPLLRNLPRNKTALQAPVRAEPVEALRLSDRPFPSASPGQARLRANGVSPTTPGPATALECSEKLPGLLTLTGHLKKRRLPVPFR